MEWVLWLLGLSVGLNLGALITISHQRWLRKRLEKKLTWYSKQAEDWEEECREHHLPGDCPLCGAV